MSGNYSWDRHRNRSLDRSRGQRNDYRNDHRDYYRDDRRNDRRDDYRSRRNRSRSRGQDRGRDRRYNRSEERLQEEKDKCRIHISDLHASVTQYDIERIFMKFGEITEVWTAKNPPCFGFCVFKNEEDAAQAVREMNNKVIGQSICKVSFALPRTKGARRWSPSMKCYQCGNRGHFSRDCDGVYKQNNNYSYEEASRSNNRRSHSRRRSRSW